MIHLSSMRISVGVQLPTSTCVFVCASLHHCKPVVQGAMDATASVLFPCALPICLCKTCLLSWFGSIPRLFINTIPFCVSFHHDTSVVPCRCLNLAVSAMILALHAVNHSCNNFVGYHAGAAHITIGHIVVSRTSSLNFNGCRGRLPFPVCSCCAPMALSFSSTSCICAQTIVFLMSMPLACLPFLTVVCVAPVCLCTAWFQAHVSETFGEVRSQLLQCFLQSSQDCDIVRVCRAWVVPSVQTEAVFLFVLPPFLIRVVSFSLWRTR